MLTAVRAYRVYLTGSVIVYTDHSPLAFLKRMAGVNQKLLRWSLELDQFDVNIQHIRGRENLHDRRLSFKTIFMKILGGGSCDETELSPIYQAYLLY